MRAEDAHGQDCQLLGIDVDSRLVVVERAYRNLKGIYTEGSLATYGLFEDGERQEKLEQLEGAYGRITRRLSRPAAELPVSHFESREEDPSKLLPDESTGGFLRQLRENAGLTLKDLAHRTKVSPMRLDQIEQEKFDLLPAPVYLRGFVFAYAKAVGFAEPQKAAAIYLERYRKKGGTI
jgi:flagellar biosynthesis protein FlhG